jgi:hypothetical protein
MVKFCALHSGSLSLDSAKCVTTRGGISPVTCKEACEYINRTEV